MHTIKLKKWVLTLIMGVLLGVSIAATTVIANTKSLTVQASELNVRLGPGLAYNVMGQVAHGSQLTVISKKNSWYQVRLAGNKVGWVASWLVDQNEPTTSSAKVMQATTNAPVHQYATTTAKILGTVNPGTTVNVIYQEGQWSQISYNNTAAWVATSQLEDTGKTTTLSAPRQTQTATTASTPNSGIKVTTTTGANIRQAGGINAPVVEHVAKGATLNVLNQSGEWYKVRTNSGKVGFVASWIVSMPGATTNKAATSLGEATIVLDPGHGGSDAGAQSNQDTNEKTYTLAMAKKVGAKLQAQGANVIYTRTTDTFVDLAPRPIVAEKAHADAFISFHFDSTAKPNSASGFTTYYYDSKTSNALAKYLNQGFSNLTLTNRGVAFGNYEVLRDNRQPSVLLEMGYINSDKDYKRISSSAYQDRVATDIVQSLTAYFKAGNHQ